MVQRALGGAGVFQDHDADAIWAIWRETDYQKWARHIRLTTNFR